MAGRRLGRIVVELGECFRRCCSRRGQLASVRCSRDSPVNGSDEAGDKVPGDRQCILREKHERISRGDLGTEVPSTAMVEFAASDPLNNAVKGNSDVGSSIVRF
jgi:hypothetical protein